MCEAPEACGCLVSREGMQGPWWGRGSEQRTASGYRRSGALRGEPEGGTKGGAQVRGRVLTRESVLVPWGCLNKVPTDWVASNNRYFFNKMPRDPLFWIKVHFQNTAVFNFLMN